MTLEPSFCAAQDFRSGCPSERLSAVRKFTALARKASPPIGSSAAAILANEFGPYAASDGLPGCAAPISEVERCSVETRDCRDCPWVWLPLEEETFAAPGTRDWSQQPFG